MKKFFERMFGGKREESPKIPQAEKVSVPKPEPAVKVEKERPKGEVICTYNGNVYEWACVPDGVVIRDGHKQQLLLNGQEVLLDSKGMSEASYNHLGYNEFGVSLELKDSILFNGDQYPKKSKSWLFHPHGIVFKIDNQFVLSKRSGEEEVLYDDEKKEVTDIRFCQKGMIIEKPIRDPAGRPAGARFFLGNELLYEGDVHGKWTHPEGIITLSYGHIGVVSEHEKKKFLLNGDVLYNGPWDSWQQHPKGVLIHDKKGGKILLNGQEVVYEGDLSGLEVKPHTDGVVIRFGNTWELFRSKEKQQ